jgi:hypothetical protein
MLRNRSTPRRRTNRRVQVETLRSTPTRPRTIIGEIKDPCDLVLAIRPDFDCAPTEAIEIPRDVADLFVGKNGKVSWTAKLVAHPRVRYITAEELVAGLSTPRSDAPGPGRKEHSR